jgi:hypothetical protein
MMAKGGNPNWEWQLIHPSGHTNDLGLRQRALVNGTYHPWVKSASERLKSRAKGAKARNKNRKAFNLAEIFKSKVE